MMGSSKRKENSFGYEWLSVKKITQLSRHGYSMFLDSI